MTPEELERLLDEDESAYLEFKEKIDLASKAGKASFLKEILALVNTLHAPSFLIIGVEDKTKNLVGVTDLTEERLQQIVAEHCRPLIPFSYKAVEFKGKSIGVLQIFRSNFKPHTLKSRYGYQDANGKPQEIRDNQIFIRHGSVVAEATREEVTAIAQDRDTNIELMARLVAEIEKMGAELSDTNYTLGQISHRAYANRPREIPDRVLEGAFVSIITGGLVGWLSTPWFAPILWFVVGLLASALRIVRYGFWRTLINCVVLGVLLMLPFGLLDNTFFVGILPRDNQAVSKIVFGSVVGGISGAIGSFLLLYFERRMR